MTTIYDDKAARLKAGGCPRIFDLFSGAGGFSLGFHRAGFRSIAGVELDKHAAASYAANFHAEVSEESFQIHATARDITELDSPALLRSLGHHFPETAVDVIIGGPPCPAFTRVGRAKLREVLKHPEGFKQDPRWKLYRPYLEMVTQLKPMVVVMENVPDLMNFGGENLAEEISDTLEEQGYRVRYTILNSSNYGVPQMRDRFFLLAFHKTLGAAPSFPPPTHHVDLPSGYLGSRAVALKVVSSTPLLSSRFQPLLNTERAPNPAVTVEQAIGDLPPITEHLTTVKKKGAVRFNKPRPYGRRNTSPYAEELKTWPGFAAPTQLWDHETRNLGPRDIRLFTKMQHADDYPKAHALAVELFEEHLSTEGKNLDEDSAEYIALRKSFIPPYDPNKFPNKWRKMHPKLPARTLMAHLGKDCYTHIHYDGSQARVLSVREAARLQSFPDGFKFSGTMNPAYRQIGNAVPPLLSYALARHISSLLGLNIEKGAEE